MSISTSVTLGALNGGSYGSRSRSRSRSRSSAVRPAPASLTRAEPGRDRGHPDALAHRVVDDCAEDDVRIRVGGSGHDLRGLVHFREPELTPTRDVEEDSGRAVERGLEQRRRDRRAGGLDRPVLALRDADSHHRRACIPHDRAHVREVEVDETRDGDEIGDALDALPEDVVDHAEGLRHRRRRLDDLKQPLVLDDDERVDLLAEVLHALLGLPGAHSPLEGERARDDADGQRAELTRDLGDDGRAAGSGPAALAGRDEDHVCALERLLQLVAALLGGGGADAGVCARTEPAGRLGADMDLHVGLGHQERLRVRVHGDELDARHAGLDHPRHRVRAAASDADDLDNGEVAPGLVAHRLTPLLRSNRRRPYSSR